MFKNAFQSGFLSILYSIGSKPLHIWDQTVVNGHIKRLTDEDIQSTVLELMGTNNMKKYFTFEVQVLDDKNVRRRFKASNFEKRNFQQNLSCFYPSRNPLDVRWQMCYCLISPTLGFVHLEMTLELFSCL